MDPHIERRILFLIDAAKHEEKRDQVVTYAMRVLSNHAAIGKDAGSAEIKKMNCRVSIGAEKLLNLSKFEICRFLCSAATVSNILALDSACCATKSTSEIDAWP